MEKITTINQIDTKTEVGKLLIAAVGTLMCTEGRTSKTPEKILEELNEKAKDFVI